MTPDRISDKFVYRDFVVSQAVELEAVGEKIEVMRVHVHQQWEEGEHSNTQLRRKPFQNPSANI